MSDTYNLEIYQGSTFSIQITAKDAVGDPLDLSSYVGARGAIRFNYGDDAPLLELSPSIESPASGGVISLSIPATGTAVLPITKAPYDIEIYTSGDVNVRKIIRGVAIIHPEATY